MRVTLFTHLPPAQAEESLRESLMIVPTSGWRVAGWVRHGRFGLRSYLWFRWDPTWLWLRGRLVMTTTGTRIECHYGVPPLIGVLATIAAIVVAFGLQPSAAPWLLRGTVSAGAGALVAALLAFAFPAVMWFLWQGELVGFLKDAVNAELLND